MGKGLGPTVCEISSKTILILIENVYMENQAFLCQIKNYLHRMYSEVYVKYRMVYDTFLYHKI